MHSFSVICFALACVVPLAATVRVGATRIAPLLRRAGLPAVLAYGAMVVLQHVAVACLFAAVTLALLPWCLTHPVLTRWGIGSLFTLYGAIIALDATLFVASGFRLEIRLGGLAMAAHDFSSARAWRALLGTLMALAALAGSAAAWLEARTVEPAGPTAMLWLAGGGAAFALQAALGRRVPMAFCYEWNNLLSTVTEIAWVRTAARLRWARGRELSLLLTSQCEESTPTDLAQRAEAPQQRRRPAWNATYPLLRTTHAFTGERHFDWTPAGKPHVVLLFLESFGAREVGALGGTHGITPHFDALCEQGVLWENFYANGTITSRAAYASLFGVPPHPQDFSTQSHHSPPPVIGIADILRDAGYRTAYFHNGPIEWENARTFFLNHGFSQVFAQQSITRAYPEAMGGKWNFDDRYLFRLHADWLATQHASGQPTFSTLFTITNHFPFTAPPHAAHPAVDCAPESMYAKYLRTFMYTDQCLGAYMADLRARGLDKGTVFLILGDHGQERNLEGADFSWSGNYSDGAVRVPLLLMAPGLKPQRIRELASQVDLLPTVLDLLDLRVAHHSTGTSLVRRCEGRHAVTCHPFQPSFLSVRFGAHRFVHSFDTGRSALYNLKRDPNERSNIAARNQQLMARYTREAWRWRTQLEALYANRWAPPRPPRAREHHDVPDHMPTDAADLRTIARGRRAIADPEVRRQADVLAVIDRLALHPDEKVSLGQAILRALNEATMGLMSNAERHQARAALRTLLRLRSLGFPEPELVTRETQEVTIEPDLVRKHPE